ncbi:hypothetical protein CALVIDRAFT_524869 [Calocera viscosa TUFC12733]|uniref:Uncharacterized protein n=1 Tax=Calocera viscosa (strain TUFC12733) TaxID=1330018 RepID=A0A167R5E3_CALVF|nr:hypothetical protein CALVIDRAFT_524869 [Calocera viscosa TUFC12733]
MSAPSMYVLDRFMANQSLASGFGFDRKAIERAVKRSLDLDVVEIRPIRRGSDSLTLDIELSDGTEIIARIIGTLTSLSRIESEVATMQYICQRVPEIPAPVVLYQDNHMLLMEKMPGVLLHTIWNTLSRYDKRRIVERVAEWMVELFNHRFDEMGSLYWDGTLEFFVGPMVSDPFCGGARGPMELDRGPWSTATDYFFACAQRELDLSRSLDAGNASAQYHTILSHQREAVEQSMDLFVEIVTRCRCLDEDDPDLAPFAIDMENLGPRNLFVDPDEPSKIVGVIGWQGICVRPLWACAHLPNWIAPSLSSPSGHDHDEAEYLAGVFRRTAASLDPLFVQALDTDDIRTALEDVARMDAVQDAFLILPTLESLAATLPGEEDMDGLEALLDPHTLAGRAARINLVTKGRSAGTLALADNPSVDFRPAKARSLPNPFGRNMLGLCMDLG